MKQKISILLILSNFGFELGPHGKQEIPTTVMVNGNHTSEIDTFMKKWKDGFEKLYSKPNHDDYDHYFYENVLKQKYILEQSPYFDFNILDDPLNKPVMYDEVEKVIKKLQKKKSVGWDNIPNEIIKNKSLTM